MRALPFVALAALASCTPGEEIDGVKPEGDKYDSSAVAVFVDLEFKGELLTDAAWNPEQQVEDQLLYTIGQLNGVNSVGRLDTMTLTNVRTKSEGGRTKITYDAKLPVAWGKRNDVPGTAGDLWGCPSSCPPVRSRLTPGSSARQYSWDRPSPFRANSVRPRRGPPSCMRCCRV